MSVFDDLVGQDEVVVALTTAARDAHMEPPGTAMTHAWLVTGPAGSGRSTAARAFAAALVCPDQGCGFCQECVAVQHGSHVDVEHIVPEGVTYRIDETRDLVRRSTIAPSRNRWHVFVLEDADRLSDESANALLKSIEEPPPGTVWILCAPSTEDVLATVRSRCRHLALATPTTAEVAATLASRYGVDPAMAAFAARAAQGHIGRARALATDEQTRMRRHDVLRIPTSLTDLGACFLLAGDLVATVTDDVSAICDPMDAREHEQLLAAYGAGAEGRGIGTAERRAKGMVKELADSQKRRRRRVQRDQLDRAIVDLTAFYRDVLVVQIGAGAQLVNDEMRPQIQQLAASGSPEQTLRRIGALDRTKGLLESNVTPLLAFESLLVALKDPTLA